MLGINTGAPLGGLIIDLVSWRWLFLGQAPMALLCLAVTIWRLPSQIREESTSKQNEDTIRKPDMNYWGTCLLGTSVGTFMLLCLTIQVCVLFFAVVLFYANEIYWTKDPMIPFQEIRANKIGIIYAAQMLTMFSYFGNSSFEL
ncbi:uncharacterized protein N7503_011988 [Penicillium pulvis]|uniref:uncharacterized protein n=1 Tax=Penicillium pulvis TaxID=1562058 RepID=UPI002547FB35|nr:uncharacterized protein N7503_011988 [Penicillium pulvis]KAJ5786776.1 hypothetical protein N7503_011988 [Penicillium pulvis]